MKKLIRTLLWGLCLNVVFSPTYADTDPSLEKVDEWIEKITDTLELTHMLSSRMDPILDKLEQGLPIPANSFPDSLRSEVNVMVEESFASHPKIINALEVLSRGRKLVFCEDLRADAESKRQMPYDLYVQAKAMLKPLNNEEEFAVLGAYTVMVGFTAKLHVMIGSYKACVESLRRLR